MRGFRHNGPGKNCYNCAIFCIIESRTRIKI